MRIGRTLLIFGCIIILTCLSFSQTDAGIRRRTSVLRSRTLQRTAARSTATEGEQQREMVTGQVIQLSPSLIPAAGPGGALGVGYIFYNDVDTSLNSGTLVVTGMPAGDYHAWLVFFDPFASNEVYSELVAKFTVPENGARVETALSIGLPNVINIIHAKQLVVTHHVRTGAQVGQAPIKGAAGYRGGPGRGRAVLAANIN